MSYQPQTEAATSRFLNVEKRVKRCASILMTADKATKPCPAAWFRPGGYWLGELQPQYDPLVEAGYRVILLDCPGWGRAIRSLIVVRDRILMHES